MLDIALNANINSTLTLGSAFLTIIVSFALGILISVTYMKTHVKGYYSQNFTLTLILIPAVIAVIILLVGSNVARAFSLAGAFSIARFRSAAGDPKDIAYVLFSMAAGLACGTGLFGYAALFTMLLCVFMVVLCKINFGAKKSCEKILKILIPENMNYQGAFDDILKKYTTNYQLCRVKTTDLGTLFELVYTVTMDNEKDEKEFIDELRCRNGNLSIVLSMNAAPNDF
ncbi:MAG TPA: DUF4956 domain-containing protein [Hungateiclostridium thermocellum]|uniref:DUF4956 domain-containing protein n=1 Tax=Acetivibrio thermocellus (strain ATCC 27405 / DSM 1237 / JCM 9322 / NBRC 103400 / NCIMB 10682 / NRRL B-4536 / VPI 7372) TaxID=203119 RepID=A3DDD6_ACET2|nr:DUF4956 domain-containing protein [Acetivibrio thermocellus]ABN51965.1 hypothetical protein Cthe_0730 [Acetivibrio thermocellus ATCC 27405]NLU26834.1 DUF4956 domain-containing protein [Acetivibrio thermocellus]THJ78013.1 DUF4956 domain-containing protein [Acetivibrio thermocellus]HBW26821.1 DUF4956 domain-containing protein [Acetivibrio thermocellus]